MTLSPETIAERDRLLALIHADDVAHPLKSQPQPIEDLLCVGWAEWRPLQGGGYYRATRPAALASRDFGWHTGVVERIGSVEGKRKIAGQCYGSGHVMHPDVWILRPIGSQGKGDELIRLIGEIRASGAKLVVDLDDDIWAHEDWTEDDRPSGADDDRFEEWCWDVDAWLVSTPYLKDRVEQIASRRGRTVPRVAVAPNCYDPVGIGMESHPVPGRRLGTRLWLSGRMSGDLDIYRDCFGPLLPALDLQWVHIGRETYIREDGPGVHARDFVTDCKFPAHRVVELPSCSIPEMGRMLGSLINVGCIALADHPFNRAKTETHAVELAAAGLPLVAATALQIYDKVPGRVDPTADAVAERVAHLLYPDTWRAESERARTWAKKVSVRSEATYMRALQAVVTELVKG